MATFNNTPFPGENPNPGQPIPGEDENVIEMPAVYAPFAQATEGVPPQDSTAAPDVPLVPASPLGTTGLPSTQIPASATPPTVDVAPAPAATPANTAAGGATVPGAGGAPSMAPPSGSFAGNVQLSPQAADALNAADRQTTNQEAQANLQARTDSNVQQAKENADLATHATEQAQRFQQHLDEGIALGNKWVSDANAHFNERVKQYQDALEQDKDHTIWTGKSAWQKAGAWLGMALGALGAGASAAGGHPTGNLAVAQLDKLSEQEFEKQKNRIANLKDSVAMAETGIKNAHDAKSSLIMDETAKQEAALKTLEMQARQLAAGHGVTNAQLEGSELMTMLKAKQQELEEQKQRQIRQDFLERYKTYADVNLKNAEASNARAMAGYHKALAAGQVSNGLTIKINNALQGVVDKDPEVKESLKKRDELQRVHDAIATGNPVAIGSALDSYVKAATGLGARPGNVKMFSDRLGGSFENLQGEISKMMNGQPLTPAMVKRLGDAADAQLAAENQGLSGHRNRIERGLRANPAFKGQQDMIGAVLDQKFGAPGAAPTAPVRSAADQQALDWANANPTDPRATKIKQRLGL